MYNVHVYIRGEFNYLTKRSKVTKVAKKAMNWAWLDGIPYSTLRIAFDISKKI